MIPLFMAEALLGLALDRTLGPQFSNRAEFR